MKKILFALLATMFVFTNINQAMAKPKTIDEDELYDICESVGEIYNIAPEFLESIAYQESRYQVYARNGDCKGLMQVSERWHRGRMKKLGITDIYDPYSNVLLAADYLEDLFEMNDDPYYVLMCYNMSFKTANKLYETGNYSDYAVDITERSAAMEAERNNYE